MCWLAEIGDDSFLCDGPLQQDAGGPFELWARGFQPFEYITEPLLSSGRGHAQQELPIIVSVFVGRKIRRVRRQLPQVVASAHETTIPFQEQVMGFPVRFTRATASARNAAGYGDGSSAE